MRKRFMASLAGGMALLGESDFDFIVLWRCCRGSLDLMRVVLRFCIAIPFWTPLRVLLCLVGTEIHVGLNAMDTLRRAIPIGRKTRRPISAFPIYRKAWIGAGREIRHKTQHLRAI